MEVAINEIDCKRKNLTTVAIYNALFYENRYRKKVLVSITIGDEKIDSLIKLRKNFTDSIRDRLKTKAFKGEKLAYFTNIEFGKDLGNLKRLNVHLHIQFFYDSLLVLEEIHKYIDKEQNKFKNFDIEEAKSNDAYFGYLIKDYLEKNYNEEYELSKKILAQRKAFYTSSRKDITNYVVRYIYGYYKKNTIKFWNSLKPIKRYEHILGEIKVGNILLKKVTCSDIPKKYKIVKNTAIYIKTVA